MTQLFGRVALVVAFEVVAALLLQGCYVKVGEEVVLGDKNVSLRGAKRESGCVMKVKPGTNVYPPEPSGVVFRFEWVEV